MCLYIFETKHVKNNYGKFKPLIAKKDKVVWKIISINNRSCIRDKQYKQNMTYPKVKFGYENDGYANNCIGRGYHAFLSRKDARDAYKYDYVDFNCKIVKFIIPKDAEYYIGEGGEIVSNIIKSGDLKHCN